MTRSPHRVESVRSVLCFNHALGRVQAAPDDLLMIEVSAATDKDIEGDRRGGLHEGAR